MVTNNVIRNDAVFRAISDPTRREILGILRTGPRTVGEIAANFHVSRPAISKHLRHLRSAGLVVSRKEGTASVCDLNAVPLREISAWVKEYEAFWTNSLRQLKDYVERRETWRRRASFRK